MPNASSYVKKTREMDSANSVGDMRFHVNCHFQKDAPVLAARSVPQTIPSIEELGFQESAP